ncbi:hypothetical protein [Gayadomonas joobiniege]|uniref:hypothetical protein n=1 Tax=Gayadomonas joobiniege TaxID=1234606 RepID=UPI000382CC27|nr:hypothetical protein [Gayadomonas joobiniege]
MFKLIYSLILYTALLGHTASSASPAMQKSLIDNQSHSLQTLDENQELDPFDGILNNQNLSINLQSFSLKIKSYTSALNAAITTFSLIRAPPNPPLF